MSATFTLSLHDHDIHDAGTDSPFEMEAYALGSADIAPIVKELLEARIKLALPCQPPWAASFFANGGHFVVLRDAFGKPVLAYSVELSKSRALPNHWLMRASHFGNTASGAAASAGVAALANLAGRQKNLLRVYLEVFSANTSVRQQIAQSASAHGFRQEPAPSTGYARTLRLDLADPIDDIFGTFSRSARRNIRAPGKKGFEIRAVDNEGHAARMSMLLAETLERTGGSPQHKDWARIIAFSKANPCLSRVAGCYAGGSNDPAALLSFAWGCHHGDHATHTSAASTRSLDSNLPLSYALAWDLICWAKQHGADWFDFGGVTAGSFGSDDALGGISDFKRFFTTDLISVGEGWTLEPSRLKGRLASLVGRSAGWLNSLRSR